VPSATEIQRSQAYFIKDWIRAYRNQQLSRLSRDAQSSMSSGTTLCFEEARLRFRDGKIREGEYIHHVLAHFKGVRHPSDGDSSKKRLVATVAHGRPYTTYSIREAALARNYKPLSARSITALEKLFQACAIGNVKTLETLFHAVTANEGVPVKLFNQPLAVLAVEKGHTGCFRFCLDQGANMKDYCLASAIENLKIYSSIEMIELLYEKKWKRMANSSAFRTEIASKIIRYPRGGEAQSVQWLLDHGAKLHKNDIRAAVLSGVDKDLMPILIAADTEAATIFGSVHTAVTACNPEVVEQLLEAGASPNGPGGGIYDEREGPMDTPLIEAITPSKMADAYSSSNIKGRLAIARSLLEYGANFEAVGLRGDTAVQRANRHGGKLFMDLLEEFGAYSENNPRPSKRRRVGRELQNLT
jgi:hypothetical protein